MDLDETDDHSPPLTNPSAGDGTQDASPPSGRVVGLRLALKAANHVNDADWPPFWLQVTALLAIVAIGLLALLTIWPILMALAEIGANVARSKPTQVVIAPVNSYLKVHAVGFPIDHRHLMSLWVVCGAVLLVAAFLGSIGARIGWLVFGILTLVMVWRGSGGAHAELSVGICALWWSFLSIPAYRRITALPAPYYPEAKWPVLNHVRTSRLALLLLGPQRGQYLQHPHAGPVSYYQADENRTAEIRGAEMQRRIDKSVARLGFTDVADYIKANWGRSRKTMSEELGAPEWFVKELIRANFPPRPGMRIERTPWQIKQEAVDFHRAGESFAAIGRRYKVSGNAVSRWVKEEEETLSIPPNDANRANADPPSSST
jgi:hypothetical protein